MPFKRKRNCDHCGKYYEGQGRQYCSQPCHSAATRGEVRVQRPSCKLCGKLLIRWGQRYCDRACYLQAEKPPVKRPCKQCGKEFLPERKRSVYCCQECHFRSLEVPRADVKCKFCGKVFGVKPSHAARTRFCSKVCYGGAQARRQKGKNNPNWKGGIAFKKGTGVKRGGVATASKGRRGEHKTRTLLRAEGYYVIRSAASKGIWDLVAYLLDPTQCCAAKPMWRLMQVKVNGRITKKERLTIIGAIVPPDARKELWIWRDRKREPELTIYECPAIPEIPKTEEITSEHDV